MSGDFILLGLAGVIASGAPIVLASIGETISERAGVTNLSLNGLIIFSGMMGFWVAVETDSLFLGFLTGALVGALVSAIVAFSSITLKQSQVAVGFILAITTRDLAYFLGNPIMGRQGPIMLSTPIPLLSQIPILGPLFFQQSIMTYASIILIFIVWFWIYKTRPGLMLQGIGEKPSAAYVRGANVGRMRYFYTILGGTLVGLAGPLFTLSVKAGWKGTITGLDGIGWIALAITIFGGWNPIRVAFGAYFFAFLQWLGLVLQSSWTFIPSQVLQVAPFPLMILTLLLVNLGNTEWVARLLATLPDGVRERVKKLIRSLRSQAPAALGTPFERE
ncbi:MAG TPA: ABC transporter permease [Brevefilum sp.]|nr:ABC transporter permease [Candidatus Cloacimonadota bacterium]HOE70093.1 ABC transporter permease [Brevefilum sp.]HOR19260.1 ABC transporter permease [Brevefilum sp.]HPL69488.1 ABC transporter permease [Brevefilum sp.]